MFFVSSCVNAVGHMQVTLQIVHRLQFASGVEQATDDDVAEHLVADGVVAYAVEERTEHKLAVLRGSEDKHADTRQSVGLSAPFRLLTIIMIYYNDNLYARDEGLYLMSEVIGKGCIIVDGNVRDYID